MANKSLILKLVDDSFDALHPPDIKRLIDMKMYGVAMVYLLSLLFGKTDEGMKIISRYLSPLSKKEISKLYSDMSMYVLCKTDKEIDLEEGEV